MSSIDGFAMDGFFFLTLEGECIPWISCGSRTSTAGLLRARARLGLGLGMALVIGLVVDCIQMELLLSTIQWFLEPYL